MKNRYQHESRVLEDFLGARVLDARFCKEGQYYLFLICHENSLFFVKTFLTDKKVRKKPLNRAYKFIIKCAVSEKNKK